ncbi:YceD family protein [Rhodovibrionaceae bacterium A322]
MGEFDKTAQAPESEFSRRVQVSQLKAKEESRHFEATPEEGKAIAKRLQILSVENLTADLVLKRLRGGKVIRVSGSLSADVVQACVVSLEPVPQKVAADFVVSFAEEVDDQALEVDVDPEDELDGPDLIDEDGFVDLGETLVEQLALSLDDYPRADGAELKQHQWGDFSEDEDDEEDEPNPFEVLSALKKD